MGYRHLQTVPMVAAPRQCEPWFLDGVVPEIGGHGTSTGLAKWHQQHAHKHKHIHTHGHFRWLRTSAPSPYGAAADGGSPPSGSLWTAGPVAAQRPTTTSRRTPPWPWLVPTPRSQITAPDDP